MTRLLPSLGLVFLSLIGPPLSMLCGADCNGNSLDDLEDVTSGRSEDCNANCVPDECDLIPEWARQEFSIRSLISAANDSALVDIDGDGDRDLIIAHRQRDEVTDAITVLFRSENRFTLQRTFPVDGEPASLLVLDSDNDGDEDIVVAHWAGRELRRIENRGDGTIGADPIVLLDQEPRYMAGGDFDGDGRLDLAVTLADGENTVIYRQFPIGEFRLWRELEHGSSSNRPLAEDVDGDGHTDLILSSQVPFPQAPGFSGVRILFNDAAGSFTATRSFEAGTDPANVTAFDLDGDGRLDLVLPSREHGELRVLWNEGNRNFTPSEVVSIARGGEHVLAGRLSSRPEVDLVLLGGTLIHLAVRPDRTFGEEAALFSPDLNVTGTLSDLDDDGELDVLAVTQGGVHVLTNDGDGAFELSTNLALYAGPPRSVLAQDVDLDDDVDLIYRPESTRIPGTRPERGLTVALNDGAGGFSPVVVLHGVESPDDSLAIGDLDGVGIADIAIANWRDRTIHIYFYSSLFEAPRVEVLALEISPATLRAADVDGDGDLDLLTGTRQRSISIFTNDGSGVFTESSSFPIDSQNSLLTVGDLDRDGVPEVVATLGTREAQVFRRTSDGYEAVAAPFRSGRQPLLVELADLDGDGRLDLFVGTYSPNFSYVQRGLESGDFAPPARTSQIGPIAAILDLDGDGLPELIDLEHLHVVESPPTARDENGNGVPDECEIPDLPLPTDCNRNGIPDGCEISTGAAFDCNSNGVPDDCETAELDCNSNGVPDDCDVARVPGSDCNSNGVPDGCDIASGESSDGDRDGVPDECSEFDFVRGDVNGDGVVTLADVYAFEWRFASEGLDHNPQSLPCPDVWDADDDGRIAPRDAAVIDSAVTRARPMPAPFPAPGPDPTPDNLHCLVQHAQAPAVDPEAALRMHSAVAAGGTDGFVTLTVAMASSLRVAGFRARLRVEGAIIEGGESWRMRPSEPPVERLDAKVNRDGEHLEFSFLYRAATEAYFDAGEERPVLEMELCLLEGVSPGEYSLELEYAELIEFGTGRRIDPRLEGGTLTVLDPVVAAEFCQGDPPDDPVSSLTASFSVPDVNSLPGGSFTLPFSLRTDRPATGFAFSLDFDESVLSVSSISRSWVDPQAPESSFWIFEFNNQNRTPGNAGIDEGFAVGVGIIDFSGVVTLPVDVDVELARIEFDVAASASVPTTEVRFLDGGRVSGGPIPNRIVAVGGLTYTVDVESATFRFEDSLVALGPSHAAFVRGDANVDQALDLSDGIGVLDYLFLGGPEPVCLDAADINDSGGLEIADAVTLFTYLFLGGAAPPAPEDCGVDPTEDALDCERSCANEV